MARRAAVDTSFLERRGRQWYCIKDIPTALKGAFLGKNGKPRKRLIECLKTEDLDEARRRRPMALSLFEFMIASARAQHEPARLEKAATDWYAQIIAAAGQQRAVIERLRRGDIQDVWVDPDAPVVGTPAERALSLAQWAIDEQADDIAGSLGPEAATAFREAVDGDVVPATVTPIAPLIEKWLSEEDVEIRTKVAHRFAMRKLLAWVRVEGLPETVEAIDRKVAGRYVTHLRSLGLSRKTSAKRIWSTKSFWAFLIRKEIAGSANPWKDTGITKAGRSDRDRKPERAFTPAEVHALLDGPAEPELHDLMVMALYSGARLEELCLLRVKDIDVTDMTARVTADPKSAASRRVVPIHPNAWAIVKRRMEGKKPSGFLLHELGGEPKPGKSRSATTSKAFTIYRATCGVTDKAEGQRRDLVNFHSFRRTFVTLCEQAGQPESIIRAVVGHKRPGITLGTYSSGPSLAQRRECVESVELPPA
jgi:integrase